MKNLIAAMILLLLCAYASAQTQFVNPAGLAAPHGYTHVVASPPGKMVFISGQIALDSQGKLVGKDDLKAQVGQVFENLKTALAAAGATFNDVVKITFYVKNYKPDDVQAIRQIRDTYVNREHPPASTLVGVTSLVSDDYLLEVEAIAVVPRKYSKK